MWISAEFKIYLVKEFQRLKEQELKSLDWNVKRSLTKINYRIHSDAVKAHLIPEHLSQPQINRVYAHEADVLNMALYGMTARQWRDQYPDKEGNIRDYSNVVQLVFLANLENLNAIWIEEGRPQSVRIKRLNEEGIGTPMIQGNRDFGFRFPDNRVYTTDPKRYAYKFDILISVRAPVGAQNMAKEKYSLLPSNSLKRDR